jgi:cation diffusion facilitator CzcD-associated flavoprotein CzcO
MSAGARLVPISLNSILSLVDRYADKVSPRSARVDSQYPIYAYSIPEVYRTWTWTEEYPGFEELRRYFVHIDRQLNISQDVIFNTKVTKAKFDNHLNKWSIKCEDGRVIQARFFLPAIGFAAKRLFPDWKGLNSFNGVMLHSSFWPREGLDVKGKKMAVVGTGATGIQIAQSCARKVGELTVFQRTPNMSCPMRQ